MPADILGALTSVLALIAFGLLCGAYLCPKHFDERYREWTVRRRRRKDAKRCAPDAPPADAQRSPHRS